MGDKALYRVHVEGQLWVLAESRELAELEARGHLGHDVDSMEFYVYPFLPKPDLLDDEVLESIPWGEEEDRTVGEYLRARAAKEAAPPPRKDGDRG